MSSEHGEPDPATIAAVHQLLGRYGFIVDARRFDRFAEVFTPDGVFDASAIGIDRYDSLAAIQDGFAVIGHPISHHTTNIVVLAADHDTAEVVSKFIVPLRNHRIFSGEYHDTLARTEAGWRIRRRVVTASRLHEGTL